MKHLLILFVTLLLAACSKDNIAFSLEAIQLNDYRKSNYPAQKLRLEVYDGETPMVHTDTYSSELTLPATFAVHPSVTMALYKKTYRIRLWGDSTGYIGACDIDMKAYKIIFPIEMEVENDSLNVSIMGSWK